MEYKIGDKVKVIRSHRQDVEGMVGELIEIKGDDLKYHVKVSKNFSLWARKIEHIVIGN